MKLYIVHAMTNNNSITIRRPRVEDISHIHALGLRQFTWIFERTTWRTSLICSFLDYDSDYCRIAEADGVCVGFCLGSVLDDYGYISWVAVEDDYRRQKLASQMIEESLAAIRKKVRKIYCHARESSEVISMFSTLGFQPTDERKIEMIINN